MATGVKVPKVGMVTTFGGITLQDQMRVEVICFLVLNISINLGKAIIFGLDGGIWGQIILVPDHFIRLYNISFSFKTLNDTGLISCMEHITWPRIKGL